jgi:hypothetical protein
VKRLTEKYGADGYESVMQWSSQRPHHTWPNGPSLIDVLEQRNQLYDTVLEIGTARGMSALILAHWADTVHTIDIYKSKWIPQIFIDAGVADRIVHHVVKDNAKKAKVIRGLDFEMANIDGNHTRPEAQIDFDLTKHCGLLLFHDFPKAYREVDGPGWVLGRQTEGVVTDLRPFAWWEAKK